MEYSWKTTFEAVPSTGIARMAQVMKLMLHEIPRLHEKYASPNPKTRKEAKNEIFALFEALDIENVQCRTQSGLTPEAFSNALQSVLIFTPEEKKALSLLPPLLKIYGLSLF